jgi:ATP-dependent DNA helicase RecG
MLSFRLADLQRDQELLPKAHLLAERMLREYPVLSEQLLARWLPEAPRYLHV